MDDLLLNKAAIIERCLTRIEQVYAGREQSLEHDLDQQDIIILNLQRVCEAAIDAAMHVVRIKKLGVPQQSREAFRMMVDAGLLTHELSLSMHKLWSGFVMWQCINTRA